MSEKLKIGPVMNQTAIEAAAKINTPAEPASVEARDEILRKRSFMMLSITKKVNISKNVTRLFKI